MQLSCAPVDLIAELTLCCPDRKDRLAIIKVHIKDKPLGEDVDLDTLAVKTVGSSGADLMNIINEGRD